MGHFDDFLKSCRTRLAFGRRVAAKNEFESVTEPKMLKNLFSRAERLVRKQGHPDLTAVKELDNSWYWASAFRAMLPIEIRINLVNLFDSHPRAGDIFRERGLPHAPFNQFHGTVPNKATDLFLGMFRQAKMAKRIVHRHGKVAESIEQSTIKIKNNKGFFRKHRNPIPQQRQI